MNTWKEIERTIRANAEKIEKNNETVRAMPYSRRNEPELLALSPEAERLAVENKILHDNARIAYMRETLPDVLEILNSFAGKPFGPKTKEKAQERAKTELHCSFYFDGPYTLELIPLNDRGYSGTMFNYNDLRIYARREKIGDPQPRFLDENNRIIRQSENPENYKLSDCGDYVEDVSARASEITAAYFGLRTMHDALEKACSAFNAILPSGITSVSPDRFYPYLRIA